MLVTTTLLFCLTGLAQSPDLSFHSDPGNAARFTFDTGRLKGFFHVDDKSEGLMSCIDVATGKEMMRGDGRLGLFQLYRLLSTNKRWGDMIWAMPKKARLAGGSLVLKWAPTDEHPFEITATYRWSAPDSLDLEVQLKAGVPAPRTEVFLGSYLNADVLPRMYFGKSRPAGQADFIDLEATPLVLGTYYMFPRDLSAAQMIFDGRWRQGHNPVDWAVTRYMTKPIALQHDPRSDRDVLLIADPRTCFAIAMSYHLDPPDGVASHHSTYISLFGEDVKKGDSLRAHLRAVIGGPFTAEQAVGRFEHFTRSLGESRSMPATSSPSQ